ncbi:MAG: c-type cytochrome [Thermoanaerobaculia bacterium]
MLLIPQRGAFGAEPAAKPADKPAEKPAEKTMEEEYKNIVVFKGLPSHQLDGAMAFMSAALGVGCAFCHAITPDHTGWEKDDKKEKKSAREMVEMTRAINKQSFGGKDVITCATCHQGHPHPSSRPPVDQIALRKASDKDENPDPKAAPMPTVEQVLGAYTKALGSDAALAGLKTQIVKATSVGSDGASVKQDFIRKAPNKLLIVTREANGGTSRQGTNGTTGWMQSKEGERDVTGPPLTQLKRNADFTLDTKLAEQFKKLSVAGRDTWNGHDTVVLRGTAALDDHGERLWFDTKTGLLVRRDTFVKTILGSIPDQTEFDDFRVVKGVKTPYVTKRTTQWMNFTRTVDSVVQNPMVQDSSFEKPAPMSEAPKTEAPKSPAAKTN